MCTVWENDIFPNIEFVYPSKDVFDWEKFIRQKSLVPFDPRVLAFCEAFSKKLLSDRRCLGFPDLTALGFWFRGARLKKMMQDQADASGAVRVGRGVVFHLAPGNVDTIFVYSSFHALLAGNVSIVRLGGKTTSQQSVLLEVLKEVLAEYPEIASRFLIVRYGHDDKINGFFSSVCHVRVIWGGDSTVEHIRQIPIPAGSSELAFAGKFSLAVFDAEKWLASETNVKYIPSFLTDVFSFGQQGCSSPKLICWRGEKKNIAAAQESFWSAVDAELLKRPFEISPAESMDRLLAANSVAAESETPVVWKTSADKKSYFRLELADWSGLHRSLNTGNGLFFEIAVQKLEEVLEHSVDSDQSVVSFGIAPEEWREAVSHVPPRGICRIVPFGKALDFNSVWDGHDLIAEMSRQIVIQS